MRELILFVWPDVPCHSQGFLSSVHAVSVEEVASPVSQVENAHGHTLRIYIYLYLNGLPDGSGQE